MQCVPLLYFSTTLIFDVCHDIQHSRAFFRLYLLIRHTYLEEYERSVVLFRPFWMFRPFWILGVRYVPTYLLVLESAPPHVFFGCANSFFKFPVY